MQKDIIYEDEDFILKGEAVVCNTRDGIPGVKVTLKNPSEGSQKSTITDSKGLYKMHVKQNKVYTIFGQKDMYFSQTETVNTKDFDRNTTLFVQLEVCMEVVECDKALALQNIHYDVNQFVIREDAKRELDRLVQFIKDNPGVSIELSSHTDSRGSNDLNKTLSQKRASAAVDYLVSQGISRSRIIGIGYGETRLVNGCADGVDCTDMQHQLNRRTEFKVNCPK